MKRSLIQRISRSTFHEVKFLFQIFNMKLFLLFLFICVTHEKPINDYEEIIGQHKYCCNRAYKGAQFEQCVENMKNAITNCYVVDLFIYAESNYIETLDDVVNAMIYACNKVFAINKKNPLQPGAFAFLVISGLFPAKDKDILFDYYRDMISNYGSDLEIPMSVGANWWQYLLNREPDFLDILTDSNKAKFKEYLTNVNFKTFYYNYRKVTDDRRAIKCYITKVMDKWKANENAIAVANPEDQRAYIIPTLFKKCV